MMQCLFAYLMNWFYVFGTAILTWETDGFELASTITLVLEEYLPSWDPSDLFSIAWAIGFSIKKYFIDP